LVSLYHPSLDEEFCVQRKDVIGKTITFVSFKENQSKANTKPNCVLRKTKSKCSKHKVKKTRIRFTFTIRDNKKKLKQKQTKNLKSFQSWLHITPESVFQFSQLLEKSRIWSNLEKIW